MTVAPDIVVHLRSRRRERALFVQKLQHGMAGVLLLFKGLEILQHGAEGFELALGIVEVLTSVLLIGALVRGMRRLRRGAPSHPHHAHGIDWIDVFVAGVLAVEALERWHADHHIARPTILLALVMLAIGLLHGRIATFGGRRRALRVTAEGISVPRRPFGRFSVGWGNVRALRVDAREAIVEARDGRSHRIDLLDLENAGDVVSAFEEARRRVTVTASAAATSSPGAAKPRPAGSSAVR